jgi:hypothetical protein
MKNKNRPGKPSMPWIPILLCALLISAGGSTSACKAVGPDVIIAAAIGTAVALGSAVANKKMGGCYSICDQGYACNPASGLCEQIPCGGCPADMQCNQEADPPECVPMDVSHLRIKRTAPEADDSPEGDPAMAEAEAEPPDPPGCARITNAHPVWPTPAIFVPADPLFFVRLNQRINPEQLLADTQVLVGEQGWQKDRFKLLHSFLVVCPQGACTDVFFKLDGPVAPGTLVSWRVVGADDSRLGPPCPGADQGGAYLVAKFRVGDESHPINTPDNFWSPEQMARAFGEEEAERMLRKQSQTMAIIQGYRNRGEGP